MVFISASPKIPGGKTGSFAALLFFLLTATLLGMVWPDAGQAGSPPNLPSDIETGLTHLVALCSSGKDAPRPDLELISKVAGFVLDASETATYTPEDRHGTKGSFIVYTIRRSLPDIIRYAYNGRIPGGAINPSSIDYSYWKRLPADGKVLPDVWKALDNLSAPLVARGVVRESISPDMHTGAYYEYDLQRAFLLYRQGTRRVVVSLSNQIGDSDIGRKGYIVGNDQDWDYLYTPDQGLDKKGLGWVKSKIYTFSSICFYIEDEADPGAVQIGVFQWLGAGWVGINLVDSHHIHNGLERYAEQFKGMLESDNMPAPETLERMYAALSATQEDVLRAKAVEITRHIKRKAEQDEELKGKGAIREMNPMEYVAQMDKERLISMLVREYVKYRLGKETALTSGFWLALKDGVRPKG